MATFNFVNAYSVNTATTPAGKEANSHDIIFTDLGPATIDDTNTNSRLFSGNDVSAIGINIGGQTYYGWVSRPVKVGGEVKAFYFWTDAQFTDLNSAQTDGNQDGDGNVSDNSGFILVIDQDYFTSLGWKNQNANLKNVGSSSDRVDSAINALIQVNSAPIGVNDIATVLEDAGSAFTGNVLTNDTDANNDLLSVTGFNIGNTTGSLGSATTINGVGSFTLNANGSYSFTPALNYAGPVPVVTYTLSDGQGGTATATLSIKITTVNDAPSGTDKTISFLEGNAYTFNAADFGFSDTNDSPANQLTAVKITSLPSLGSLTLNGSVVSAGDIVQLNDISKLKFTPETNGNGNSYANFTFKVQDNGGTTNGGVDLDVSANTITFNISNTNSAPVAVADTATAIEAGGTNNATAGTNPSGNVLTNDTDIDAGDGKTVTAITGGSLGSATKGTYGSITLNSDGSYTYTVDNSNTNVQALRLSNNTLTDTFSYTMKDTGGLTSSSTLTVTIEGKNDAPVANADFANTSISTSVANTVTGNVLTNDTDVDQNSETKSLTGLTASADYSSYAPGGTSTSLSFASNNGSFYNGVSIGDYVYTTNQGGNSYFHLKTSANALITVTSKATNADGTFSIGLSGTVDHYSTSSSYPLVNGTSVVFATNNITDGNNITGTKKEASITSSTSVISSTVTLTDVSGNIVAGMTATGNNIPDGAKVTAVSISGPNTIITLDKDITSTPSGSISFAASAGSTVTGTKGSLQLNADGSYTYTTFIDSAGGTSGTDVFSYTMQDGSTTTTSSAKLTINVQAASASTTAVTDTKAVNEDSTPGAPIGNLLTNDTASSGTKSISNFTWNGQAGQLGTPMTITGVGTLTVNSNGDYTFTPAANYTGTVPLVGYTMTNGTTSSSSTLTISITAANDAPLANNDTATASEAGGTGNAIAGFNPTGNVLTNDTDADSTNLIVTAVRLGSTEGSGTVGSIGQDFNGSYGTLHLNSNGSYTYTVNNNHASVQALEIGQSLTESFNYTMSDGGLTDVAVLTLTINGANDAPINTLPGSPTLAEGASSNITGISVADVDDNNVTVTLSVVNGTLSISNPPVGVVTNNNTNTVTLAGTQANINTALSNLSYQGNAYFNGTDTLTITTVDAGSLQDIDTLDIIVTPDNRLLTVSNPTVNEASPYAVFSVGGATGQKVALTLDTTGTGSGHATAGGDFGTNLEYFNGSNWTSYNGTPVTMPSTTLLVRTPILQDLNSEGSETFKLIATNSAGTANATGGVATVRDDGQGDIYPDNATGAIDNNALKDDDRPITITDIEVNEASPFAVFTLSGTVGQNILLALNNGSASDADHGVITNASNTTQLEYLLGSTWTPYTTGAIISFTNPTLLVRTTVNADAIYEGPESFGLVATNTGGRSYIGTATIKDDGVGNIYPDNTIGSTDNNALKDNDLALAITSHGPVNEGSTYAMFTVTGTAGQGLSLALGATSSLSDADATTSGFSMQFSTDGTTWTTYTSLEQPVLPGISGTSSVYVRVNITSEHDATLENVENFTLTAATTLAGAAGTSATATNTIIDNGSGSQYTGVVNSGTPETNNSNLDDDRSAGLHLSQTSLTTSETGSTASFTVKLNSQPTSDVTVTLTGLDTTEGSLSTSTLTFTAANWNTPQTVTVTGLDDNLIDGPIGYSLTATSSSGDSAYDGANAQTATVAVSNTDNDNNNFGPLDISTPTDTGVDDLVTSNGFPVLNFSGPTGLSLSIKGANGELLSPNQYAITDSNGSYTVILLDADLNKPGNQPFGDYAQNTSTGNQANELDGFYTLLATDNQQITTQVGQFEIDTTPPSTPVLLELTDASDNVGDNNPNNFVTAQPTPTFTVSLATGIGTDVAAGYILKLWATPQAGGITSLVSENVLTTEQIVSGHVDMTTISMADGLYTFRVELYDQAGNVKDDARQNAEIRTDLDGIAPSTESAFVKNGVTGDFNGDNIADYLQNNVTTFPVSSYTDFVAGSAAPVTSFGSLIAGNPNGNNLGNVALYDDVQLSNVALLSGDEAAIKDLVLSNDIDVISRLQFTISAQADKTLQDINTAASGLQTRVVLELPDGGMRVNAYYKVVPATESTPSSAFKFMADGNPNTLDDGAELLDLDGNGTIDRVIVTLTDNGLGDLDPRSGFIADPAYLVYETKTIHSSKNIVLANDVDNVILENKIIKAAAYNPDCLPEWLKGSAKIPSNHVSFANLKATGNALDNQITGNDGHNQLSGLAGNDLLVGLKGNDVLIGGDGSDELTGGAGKDVFRYLAFSNSGIGDGNRDVITDFTYKDKINLKTLDANINKSGNQAFKFIGDTNFSNVAGQLRFENGIVQADNNGDGQTDFEIELLGVNTLSSSDFVL